MYTIISFQSGKINDSYVIPDYQPIIGDFISPSVLSDKQRFTPHERTSTTTVKSIANLKEHSTNEMYTITFREWRLEKIYSKHEFQTVLYIVARPVGEYTID